MRPESIPIALYVAIAFLSEVFCRVSFRRSLPELVDEFYGQIILCLLIEFPWTVIVGGLQCVYLSCASSGDL